MPVPAFLRVLWAALWLALSSGLAVAQAPGARDIETALDKLAADSFGDTEAAIALIARSGVAAGVAILEALGDRRLFFVAGDTAVFYKDAAGRSFNARSGVATDIPASASSVRLNNRLRGQVQAALGSMTLLSPDPAQRLKAAETVVKSRDASALPTIDAALAQEKDDGIRRALEDARAVLTLSSTAAPEPQRIAAAQRLAANSDNESLSLLRQMAGEARGGLKDTLDRGIAAIEGRQKLQLAAQTVWFGISLGSVLLLAAIGLAITFGVMGVINMAHGEMVMLGAYVTFLVQEGFRAKAPHLIDWSLPLAIPLAFLATALVGIAIERGVIRFLYGRPLETLLATFGISLILQQAIRSWFGPTNLSVASPSFMTGAFNVMGLQVTYGRLWIVVFTLVIFALLLVILKATPLGLQMRAVTQNRRMASAMGIRTRFVDMMTFGLGSGIAGMAGVALSQIDNVSPNLGQSYIIDSFMVVVFGGVGNLWGTLFAAFTLGIANKGLEPFAGAVLAKIAILVLLILFIQKRPRGLFALKGRAVDQ
ncbi:urea ABC transporter permease subunit UrtB [Candidatus Raskinella chloraquaticus]|uniref:Urea ABC transporter permease subunit UrtB n=1 Tax=Candidatus Raskinella chloraquaticus TaxID=1951219 RepID=A0A1W9HYS5_9HYPH|nr:MAG: urea ABC transporter permease subunit UrtB [Proteobacteria bacterium SG_bin8]